MRHVVDSLRLVAFQRAAVEAVLAGALGGVVGAHVLVRRLPFFVVAMSHATFPGIVLASLVGVSLFVGGAAFALVVVAVITGLGVLTELDDTSLTGVVLAGGFAVGVVILSARPGGSRDLSAFLVGSILNVTRSDIATTASIGGVLVIGLVGLHKELVLGAFDPGGSAALGYPTAALDAAVLAAVAVAMVVMVPAVGTLLAVALLTVPALAARQWTDRMGRLMVLAACFGAASGVLGLVASAVWRVAAGGAIALAAAALFAVSATVSRRD